MSDTSLSARNTKMIVVMSPSTLNSKNKTDNVMSSSTLSNPVFFLKTQNSVVKMKTPGSHLSANLIQKFMIVPHHAFEKQR